jgi:hypothetical protein
MASETLFEKLNYTSARRDSRLSVANWVLSTPEVFPELLEYCFHIKEDISYKACWTLEFVCIERLELLFPCLGYYFENLPKVYKDQALRPLAKICELLAVQYYQANNTELKKVLIDSHRKTMTSCCFDWLITNQRVACEVYAMSALYYLGTESHWVHTELKTIVEANMHLRSAAYKARAKKVLAQISKFSHK